MFRAQIRVGGLALAMVGLTARTPIFAQTTQDSPPPLFVVQVEPGNGGPGPARLNLIAGLPAYFRRAPRRGRR